MEVYIYLYRQVLELNKWLDEELQWENRLSCRKMLHTTMMHLVAKSALVRKCGEDPSHGAFQSSGTANPALLPGESLKEKYQQEREPSWKPQKLLLWCLGKAASVRPEENKEEFRVPEPFWALPAPPHLIAGGHCMATGAKWPNPAHSCLSKPTLTALSEAFLRFNCLYYAFMSLFLLLPLLNQLLKQVTTMLNTNKWPLTLSAVIQVQPLPLQGGSIVQQWLWNWLRIEMKLRNYQRRFGWGLATASKALYSWNVMQPASKPMRSCDRDYILPQKQKCVPVIFPAIKKDYLH